MPQCSRDEPVENLTTTAVREKSGEHGQDRRMVALAVLSTSPGISAPRRPANAASHRATNGVGLGALLGATALLYLWPSSASGWSNEYYAAAAQAGAQSWKAFFFGSLDAGNAITVDKPPLGLWPMALSARLLGLSPFSVLLPQALAGVATVALVVSAVRHLTDSPRLGLLAGGIFALTPVSVLVFRYNNPDALLIFLLVAAAGATTRALDSERAGAWMVGVGVLVGLGFLTKMGEALMVVPALSLTYLTFSAAPLLRRAKHLLGAAAALVFSAGWWVAIVMIWPAASRPWIGGTTTNSVMDLAFGYNGVGRISGADAAAATGGTWQLSRAGSVFGLPSATASLWLLPAALLLSVAALRLTRGGSAISSAACWIGDVARMGRDDAGGVRGDDGDLPLVLHHHDRPRDRCAGGRGRSGGRATPGAAHREDHSCLGCGADRRAGLRAPDVDARLAPAPTLGRARCNGSAGSARVSDHYDSATAMALGPCRRAGCRDFADRVLGRHRGRAARRRLTSGRSAALQLPR
ncbi:MAG: hypothetical protein CMJ44_14725 [Pimelobacter sp.]|nr:hypothetical protein [Pimelobacter sp.]